ncbi:GlxA family transcriptional regulator [Litoribrevibacter albus]|uniref:Transcriptional regulator n=1 Tax=Litoribrevibacter albus TaxID=1473156 RepID=A0AA37SC11_9GAMM|nr:helix-turn-helix domain-containing protein [Litoribrevibacter albus]GLQ33337.1 transcriptional regulator [Litoribrevibacter albus]
MKSIAVLAPKGCPLTSVSGPLEMLMLANARSERTRRLELALVSADTAAIACQGGFQLQGHIGLDDQTQYDCVVIGAIGPPNKESLSFDPATVQWLIRQHQGGARLVSICTGAFLLAATGLLDGRRATTHWAMASVFTQLYPLVLLDPAQMVTMDQTLWCSGGASSYQDITLLLIRDYYGDAVAEQVAKLVLIDLDRTSQLKYMHFIPARQHQDEIIHQVQNRLEEDWRSASVVSLAEGVHLSERQFKRRFKQATGLSPLEYLQAVRIEHAKRALAHSQTGIEQVALSVGYEDVRFFRKLFKRQVGVSPSEFRDKSRF